MAQPDKWESRGIGGGGALFSPSLSPFGLQRIFVSSDMSAIFESTDFGRTWNQFDYRMMAGSSITGKIAFTSSPLIMYSIHRIVDGFYPVKSTDGGITWQRTEDPTQGNAYYLYADPDSTNRLFVTDYNSIYYSSDAGATWESKYTQQNAGADGCYIAGALFDGDIILIATQSGIVSSYDAGLTFDDDPLYALPGASSGIVSFSAAYKAPLYRLSIITRNAADLYPGITGAEYAGFEDIYTMDITDGITGTWTSRKSSLPAGIQPFFCRMAKDDPNKIYMAGGSDQSTPSVLKSTNGGISWTQIFQTSGNRNIITGWSGDGGDRVWSYGEFALGFDISPANSDYLALTDLGFVHVSSNGGNSWTQAYVNPIYQNPAGSLTPQGKSYASNGMENTSIWNILWADSLTVLGCYSDIRGIRSNDGGKTWNHVFSNQNFNSTYSMVQAGNTIYAATASIHDLYQSTYLTDQRIDAGRGSILYSTDKGANWNTFTDMGNVVAWITVDAADSNTLYASVVHSTKGGIYMNTNRAKGPVALSGWTRLAQPPRTEGHPFILRSLRDGSLIASYSARRDANGFTTSSGIFYSTDKGKTWLDRSADAMKFWTKDIVIDPHDAQQNTWYVCVWSGWGGAANGLGGLYRTTDRGQNWKKILDLRSASQSPNRISSCTISPENPQIMYVTTETDGLWYTSNLQAENPAFTQLDNFKFRQPERVFFHPKDPTQIWVTSFGNGLHVGKAAAPPPPPLPSITLISPQADTLINYSAPARPVLNIVWKAEPANVVLQSRIHFASRPDFAFIKDSMLTNGSTVALPDFVPGGDSIWYMRISARSQSGWGAWSPVIKLTFRNNQVSSVDGSDNEYKSTPLFWPNPSQGIIMMPAAGQLAIYDQQGQRLVWTSVQPGPLNIDELPNGIYTVYLLEQRGKHNYTGQIILMR
jgi:photosystem II stability/assembly factor-like uncharacterized protein